MEEDSTRERRRRQTRAAIAEAAMRLFAQRGFDQVTVAQVAAAVGVAEKTVFNYFPTKTALFFDEGDDLLAELLHTVRTRPPGHTPLRALREFTAGLGEWASHRRPVRPSPGFRAIIAASPALQDHRRAMFARYETALADLLAEQTGASPHDPEPFIAAVALVGVLRAAFETTAVATTTGRCLHLLAHGLADYAPA